MYKAYHSRCLHGVGDDTSLNELRIALLGVRDNWKPRKLTSSVEAKSTALSQS